MSNYKVQAIDPQEAYILVVEDNVANFVLIARLLAYMGIKKCEWKTSGWGVVEFAQSMPHLDLIVMDLRLPYEDGYAALKQIRAHPKLKDTRVVVVTANGSKEEMEKTRQAGFNSFIAKPLKATIFPTQIKTILEGGEIWEPTI